MSLGAGVAPEPRAHFVGDNMTIEEIGILLSLLLTIIGWSVTAYYQRQISERQIKAEREKLTQQFAHEKEILELQYQQRTKELEQQSLLNIGADSVRQISERRLTVYPKMVELVYRARNLAREIVNVAQPTRVFCDEFGARALELEESVYNNRLDLERDGAFVIAHTYKNLVMTFARLSKDLIYQIERQDSEQADRVLDEVKEYFDQIEEQHKLVIDVLSKLTVVVPSNETPG